MPSVLLRAARYAGLAQPSEASAKEGEALAKEGQCFGSSAEQSARFRPGMSRVQILPEAPIHQGEARVEESRAWNAEDGGRNTAP